MIKYSLVLALVFLPALVQAQGVISFMGGEVGNSETTLNFSGGEVVNGCFQGTSINLIAGFGSGVIGVSTSNEVIDTDIPQEFSLKQNYPNPFNPSTNIVFQLPQTAQVRLEVFNTIGAIVGVLVDEQRSAGEYTIQFNAGNLASGVYFYRLIADNNIVSTQKMLLIK